MAPSRFLQNAAKSCSPSRWLGGCIHRFSVELVGPINDVVADERVARSAITQAVDVTPFERGEPRVEPRRRHAQGTEPDVVGKKAAEAAGERVGVDRVVEIDVSHLPSRVDPGVGATGTGQARGRIEAQDRRHRRFHLALHRAESRLRSPPVKPGAVVGEIEPDSHASLRDV